LFCNTQKSPKGKRAETDSAMTPTPNKQQTKKQKQTNELLEQPQNTQNQKRQHFPLFYNTKQSPTGKRPETESAMTPNPPKQQTKQQERVMNN
jgi:hypothetical protein